MAKFRYVGNTLFAGLHGGSGQRGNVVAIRLPSKTGGKTEHKPKGKKHFEEGDEIEVTDPRAIRHLSVDPRFELVSA